MIRNSLFTIVFVLLAFVGQSQQDPPDTVPVQQDWLIDTSINYEELMDELELFLDSLLTPRSYFMASVSAGRGYFNFVNNGNTELKTRKANVYSPTFGYYHKSGPGITISGNITDDGDQLNLYQYSITPSFDFIQNMDWIGGVSYTRHFTKESLPFYLSPLQNEVNAYFTWRRSWLQPGISASYGWGSRTEYRKRERFIRLLRLRRGPFVNSTIEEDISDFSLSASVRHSFYWMHVGGPKNYLKFTPQVSFSAGTQQFGFNRTSSNLPGNARRENFQLYNSGDISVDEKLKFQPLSLTMYLRPEYNFGKFFIQPQFILDYYFPAEDMAALFSIAAGIIL